MIEINLLYIDDKIDPSLSEFLDNYKSKNKNITVNYDERRFDCDYGYEKLIKDYKVRNANVILIDSQLFENSKAANGKYTGEDFKLILKKVFPYIEVIVITQNPITSEFATTISKYSQSLHESVDDYYNELSNLIDKAIRSVCEYRDIMNGLEYEDDKTCIIENIRDSLDGEDCYDGLKKADIDNIIKEFKRIQEMI